MPVEKKSKEDTWTPSELKKAMGKDTLRREREERKKERLREDQNGEEKHRRRKDEDETKERRHHRDDDDRKRHKDKDRHHRNEDDEGRRRRRDRDSPDRNETTEEDRERQRRERREKREGKSKGDDDRRRKDDDDSKRRRPKDEDRERSNKDEDRRRHKDDDEKRRHRGDDDERRRDKDDERRRHRGDDDREKRRHRDDDDREKRRHRDEDGDRRGHRGDDDREKRKHHRDEDDRDRRKEKKDRDRHKETEEGSRKHRRHRDEEDDEMQTELDEDEREKQRRERREKKEGRDRKDGDKDDRDKRSREEVISTFETDKLYEIDARTKSAVNGRSKPKEEEEEENDYGGYEDDFEDYEEDFEEEEDEEPPKKTNLSSITPRQPRHGLQYSDDEMNDVLRALDEENDRLYKDSAKQDKYDRSDSPDDRGRGYRDSSPDEPVSRVRPKSSAINFLSAKRQVMTQKTYGKTSKRARDLLEMIELDTVTFDIMDLPPVKEYELYIRSYGRSDTRQAYVQTNDDAIDRDIQTEEIDMRNKWTQHPPEDFAGSGRGDGEKDFEDEEQSQQNKQQDLGRLSKFIQQAGQVVSILLDEERSQETTELSANKSSISMSEGYTELSKLGILQGRHVEFAYFAPTQPNMVLTVYSQPDQSNPLNPTDGKGMICVWNTNEPSYPQRILACESQPRCCCFGPYKTSIAFAGMVDGSICAWDLREPPSLHRSVEFDKTEHLLRFPTYNTAGISDSDNHISPVTTINPVTTYVDENSQQESDSKEDEKKNTDSGSGMSFQLVSSEDQGRINFWVVAELTTTDPAGSEIDLGLSPGGKVKVVISSTIKLESLVREARSLGPIRSFEMQISPTDPNHFYIGTDGGYVLHGLRFGNRAFPRTFSALTDSPVDVRSIDFSPFGHPCFLASTAEGCVHLFGTKSEKPLLTWPSKIWGTRDLRCVRWSRSRPCVFYVLDDHSQLYTFDILEGDAMPAKMETLSKENVIHIAFTPHLNVTGRHPQMLVSQEDGTIQIHTISKEYREQQTLENDFLPSYLDKF
ncbi:cytoplasmic dynein 2 intermediate chain 1-like isoform X8 [Mytilus californianus]|uniref:cytoplasmic dynein 2 intermediate chain 1-like isoform X8 n=1 Tax=Mytilus californianus TaxID=6549 RepID=UPI002247DC07|nr:cytoplasmic dynein 2 intermediate chain 1-like isoform X8 [Mytilus californianus]